MSYISTTFPPPGLVGVVPNVIYINTTDSLTSILEAGYLNNNAGALELSMYQDNSMVCITNTTNGVTWLSLHISAGGLITLYDNVVSGAVTLLSTNNGLTGGPITSTGTIGLENIANDTIMANVSGGDAPPTPNTFSEVLDNIIDSSQGDIIYRNATKWTFLPPGNAGQTLQSGGPSANIAWSNASTGTVTSIDTSNGLTGGPITTSGSISLAKIDNNSFLANISGSLSYPVSTTGTSFFDSSFGNTQGSLLYRNSTAWVILTPGTSGQFLKTQGPSSDPVWDFGNSGSVTNIATGTGLTGGPITTTGTISFENITNNTLLANISGISAPPISISTTALLDSSFSTVQGCVLYRGATDWIALPPGVAGQFLQTNGSSANPVWGSVPSGTVTNIATGTGLTGGPITGTGTISLSFIGNNSLLANTSGSSAAPISTSLSDLIDSSFGSSQGDILYRDNSSWAVLNPGVAGQVLQTGGASSNPSWASITGNLIPWNNVSTPTQAMIINNAYIANSPSLVTFSLPLTAVVGSVLQIVGFGSGGFTLSQVGSQQIIIGTSSTSVGSSGSVSSTNTGDTLSLVCVLADTIWMASAAPQGILTIV